MKILLAVDGSDGSLEAVRQVVALSSPARDQLAFYYSPPEIRFQESESGDEVMRQKARQTLADAVFAKAKEALSEAARGNVHTIVGTQAPRNGIVLAADDWRADLIVLGARGTGPIPTVKLGGVARHVARTANVPVLVTRPVAKDANRPFAVLFATDDSEASRQAGAVLSFATWPAGTQGLVMTVVEPYFSTMMPDWLAAQSRDESVIAMSQVWAQECAADKAKKQAELTAYANTLPAPFHTNSALVAEGHPAEEILKTIAEKKIDLIIVGAQGKGVWQRFMLGSTSETLLAQAPCSVLIVRRREKP